MNSMSNSMDVSEQSISRELYGGAIVCDIAESFEDISMFRTVPDHQEVYVDKLSNTTVIVEILSREDISDDEAPEHFFNDLAQFNRAVNYEVLFKRTLQADICVPRMSSNYTRCMLIGRQSVTKDHRVDDVLILMLVLRIPEKDTDLLISVSAAALPAQDESPTTTAQQLCSQQVQADPASLFMEGSGDENLSLPEKVFKEVISSFRVLDWSLFGE